MVVPSGFGDQKQWGELESRRAFLEGSKADEELEEQCGWDATSDPEGGTYSGSAPTVHSPATACTDQTQMGTMEPEKCSLQQLPFPRDTQQGRAILRKGSEGKAVSEDDCLRDMILFVPYTLKLKSRLYLLGNCFLAGKQNV